MTQLKGRESLAAGGIQEEGDSTEEEEEGGVREAAVLCRSCAVNRVGGGVGGVVA